MFKTVHFDFDTKFAMKIKGSFESCTICWQMHSVYVKHCRSIYYAFGGKSMRAFRFCVIQFFIEDDTMVHTHFQLFSHKSHRS